MKLISWLLRVNRQRIERVFKISKGSCSDAAYLYL